MAGLTFVKETGTFNFTGLYSGQTLTCSVTCSFITPTLPTAFVNVVVPVFNSGTNTSRTVGPSGRMYTDLQSALNAAVWGDEVVLDANTAFNQNVVFPYKVGSGQSILVRSSGSASLPALDGTTNARVHPSDAVFMPKLTTTSGGTPYVVDFALMAHGYYLWGLEITVDPTVSALNRILSMGDGTETTLNIPANIIANQCYIHGHSTLQCAHGVSLQSANSAVVNSHVSEIHSDHSIYSDAQGIAVWGSPGPILIDNNYVEGSDENFMCGGADLVNTGQIPLDITFTRNYCFKPPTWKGVWTCKNLYEHKTGFRVLSEGNIFENFWHDQQAYSANFKTVNQSFGMPWAETGQLTFRYNIFRNVFAGFNCTGNPMGAGNGGIGVPLHDTYIHDILYDRLGADSDYSDPGANFLANIAAPIRGLHISHITGFGDNFGIPINIDPFRPLDLVHQFVWRDSLIGTGDNLVKAQSVAGGTASLNATCSPGYAMMGNVIVGATGGQYPPGNYIPTSRPTLNSDYSLPVGSPYKNAATDGTDIGADIPTILAKTAGVDTNNKALVGTVLATSSGTSSTAALPSAAFNAIAHNTIVCAIMGSGTSFAPTLTDTALNTYALMGVALKAGTKSIAFYVAYNINANAANVVQFADTNSGFKGLIVAQFSGTHTTSTPFDRAVQGTGTATGTYTTGALSNDTANQIEFLLASDDLGGTLTLPVSFTPSTSGGLTFGYRFIRSQYNATLTITDSNPSGTIQAVRTLIK